MALDLTSLKKAISSLEQAIKVSKSLAGKSLIEHEEEVICSGVIQNFEFTFELCWKFMKRWLSENHSSDAIDGLSMKELFRASAERQLIDNVESWFDYHRKRNRTSHTYDQEAATEVFSAACAFLPDAKDFLKRLEAKND